MKRHRWSITLAISVIACFLVLQEVAVRRAQALSNDTYQELDTFASVLAIVQKNYVEPVTTKKLIDGAISGMLASLDPHSAYLTPDLYRDLEDSPDRVPSVEFPSPTPDPPSEEIDSLEFFCKFDRARSTRLITVDEGNERHGIYLAKLTAGPHEGKTALVKFTPKYHEAAHRLLAAQDPPLAPALYSCKRVIGDLRMVVMEYLEDAKTLYHFFPKSVPDLNLPPPDVRLSPVDVSAVRRDLDKAVALLGQEDLVFGDIRQANVLYLPKESRTFLVDFDGVGEHGKDRYSPCLNIHLNLGVSGSQIMKKSHDERNVNHVVSWLYEMVGGAGSDQAR